MEGKVDGFDARLADIKNDQGEIKRALERLGDKITNQRVKVAALGGAAGVVGVVLTMLVKFLFSA